jgi:prepilin peptidase CpaA
VADAVRIGEITLIAEVVFILILVAAAVSDVITYRIPNYLVLALTAVFFVVAGIHYAQTNWLSHIGAALGCLMVGFALNQFRQMGAGDVKLLGAVALWAGMSGMIALLLFMSISGLLALPLIVFARFLVAKAQAENRWKWPVPRVLTKRQGVPYGVAIALGGILTFLLHPLTLR